MPKERIPLETLQQMLRLSHKKIIKFTVEISHYTWVKPKSENLPAPWVFSRCLILSKIPRAITKGTASLSILTLKWQKRLSNSLTASKLETKSLKYKRLPGERPAHLLPPLKVNPKLKLPMQVDLSWLVIKILKILMYSLCLVCQWSQKYQAKLFSF